MAKSVLAHPVFKKFISNSFLLILVNVIIKPFWLFGIDRAVQNQMPEEYGLYYALFNFSFLLSVGLDMGMANLNNRELAMDRSLYKRRIALILSIKLLLFIAYLMVSIALAALLGYDTVLFKLILLLCLSQGLNSLIQFLRTNLTGLGFYRMDVWLSGLDKLLMILLCLPLVYGSMLLTIERFVEAQVLAYFLTALLVLILVIRYCGKANFNFSFSGKGALLKRAFPYAVLGILMGVYVRLDTVMLERLLPDGAIQASVYAEGYRLLDAFLVFGIMISAMLLPMFSELISKNGNYKKLRKIASWLMLSTAIIVSSICYFGAEWIVDLLYPGRPFYHVEVFQIILLSFIPLIGIYIYGTFLTAAGRLKYLNIIAGLAVVMNLSLNFILIPQMQALGCAIATLITQAFVFAAHFTYSIFRYK